MADVAPVASIPLGFRVLRGTVDGVRFVSRLHAEPGVVDWTSDREASLLFADRGQADLVRRQIVVREERCAAVVPSENQRAMAELNARAEW